MLTARAEEAVRFEVWREIMPSSSERAYAVVPRVLRTPFVDTWRQRPEAVHQHASQLRGEIMGALCEGRVHELVPFVGQTVGLIDALQPAGTLVQTIAAEAEQALQRAAALVTPTMR